MNRSVFELIQYGFGVIPFARPYQWNLDRLFKRADRVRIFQGGASGGRALKGAFFLREASGSELSAIRQTLRLNPLKGSPRCMCHGTLAIELWDGESLISTLALHHHQTLRIPGAWFMDAVLSDGAALARWLAANGFPEELQELEIVQKRRESESIDSTNFKAETPTRLGGLAAWGCKTADLKWAYLDPIALCHDLLRLFGVAERKWELGLPIPEANVAQALKELGLDSVVKATSRGQADPQVLFGAGRYWTTRVKQEDQLQLPDDVWALLRGRGENNHAVIQAADWVRRRRLRQNGDLTRSLGPAAVVASKGHFRNLLMGDDELYALDGTRLVKPLTGSVIFDTGCEEASFGFWFDLTVALPSKGKIIKINERGRIRRVWADHQESPKVLACAEGEIGWFCNDRTIVSSTRVLVESNFSISAAQHIGGSLGGWLYWAAGSQVFRVKTDTILSPPEVWLDRPAAAIGEKKGQVIIACSDRSLWVGKDQIGTSAFRPLALCADEDGIYLLTQESDSTWAIEHHRDGLLARGLPSSAFPSLALSCSHLYGVFGSEILAFERFP